jgi:hypothetical protein
MRARRGLLHLLAMMTLPRIVALPFQSSLGVAEPI